MWMPWLALGRNATKKKYVSTEAANISDYTRQATGKLVKNDLKKTWKCALVA